MGEAIRTEVGSRESVSRSLGSGFPLWVGMKCDVWSVDLEVNIAMLPHFNLRHFKLQTFGIQLIWDSRLDKKTSSYL